jgi:hypothetical protein
MSSEADVTARRSVAPGSNLVVTEGFEVRRKACTPALESVAHGRTSGPQPIVLAARDHDRDALAATRELDALAALDVANQTREVVASFGDGDLARHANHDGHLARHEQDDGYLAGVLGVRAPEEGAAAAP